MFIYFITEFGVRHGEALGLTWGAIDSDKGIVCVYSETSKGRRAKTLPFNEELAKLLLEWQDSFHYDLWQFRVNSRSRLGTRTRVGVNIKDLIVTQLVEFELSVDDDDLLDSRFSIQLNH